MLQSRILCTSSEQTICRRGRIMSVGRYLLRSDSRVSTASVICLFVPLYFRQLSQELSVKIKMVLGKFMVISVNPKISPISSNLLLSKGKNIVLLGISFISWKSTYIINFCDFHHFKHSKCHENRFPLSKLSCSLVLISFMLRHYKPKFINGTGKGKVI